MCHMSLVICHVSSVTCFFTFFYEKKNLGGKKYMFFSLINPTNKFGKSGGLVGGGSVINQFREAVKKMQLSFGYF